MSLREEILANFNAGYSVGNAYGSAGLDVVSDIFGTVESDRFTRTQDLPSLYETPFMTSTPRNDHIGLILGCVAIAVVIVIAGKSE